MIVSVPLTTKFPAIVTVSAEVPIVNALLATFKFATEFRVAESIEAAVTIPDTFNCWVSVVPKTVIP